MKREMFKPMNWLFSSVLYVYDSGTLLNKLSLSFILSSTLVSLSTFAGKYLFSDFQFLKWFLIALVFDIVTGVWKSIKFGGFKALTMKKWFGLIEKLVWYGVFMVIINILVHFEAGGKKIPSPEYIHYISYGSVMVTEVMSVLVNLYAIKKHSGLKLLIDAIGKALSGGKLQIDLKGETNENNAELANNQESNQG